MIRLLFHESMQQRIEHSPILAQSTEEIGVNPPQQAAGRVQAGPARNRHLDSLGALIVGGDPSGHQSVPLQVAQDGGYRHHIDVGVPGDIHLADLISRLGQITQRCEHHVLGMGQAYAPQGLLDPLMPEVVDPDEGPADGTRGIPAGFGRGITHAQILSKRRPSPAHRKGYPQPPWPRPEYPRPRPAPTPQSA